MQTTELNTQLKGVAKIYTGEAFVSFTSLPTSENSAVTAGQRRDRNPGHWRSEGKQCLLHSGRMRRLSLITVAIAADKASYHMQWSFQGQENKPGL